MLRALPWPPGAAATPAACCEAATSRGETGVRRGEKGPGFARFAAPTTLGSCDCDFGFCEPRAGGTDHRRRSRAAHEVHRSEHLRLCRCPSTPAMLPTSLYSVRPAPDWPRSGVRTASHRVETPLASHQLSTRFACQRLALTNVRPVLSRVCRPGRGSPFLERGSRGCASDSHARVRHARRTSQRQPAARCAGGLCIVWGVPFSACPGSHTAFELRLHVCARFATNRH